ncbi:MAG TPA: TonB family protein [Chthoniobacterales bacterium]|jgi:TonB family protein
MNLRFWRNLTLIGFAHAALITGLIRWSREAAAAKPSHVVWLNAAGDDAVPWSKTKSAPPASTPVAKLESKVDPVSEPEPQDEKPLPVSVRSEIQLPVPKPSPRSTSSPKPTAAPKVKVTPAPRKPKPRPTPTSTPKPKSSPKKLVIAKASPASKGKPFEAAEEKMTPVAPRETGSMPSGGGHAGGGGSESQFGWYGSMLHDRFYSEWAQPTRIASREKNSVLVKIRIEKDGRVSNFDIVRPSGDAELDESVAAVAKRITQVEPLPDGLVTGDHYDVKISFELNSD